MAHRAATNPVITVVMALHDDQDHVSRALESVSSERDRLVQIVLVDCASHDRTLDICKRSADRDIRIDAISCESADRFIGRSKGLELARGRYVTFLDGDCWLKRGSLDAAFEAIDAGDFDIAFVSHALDSHENNGTRRSRFVYATGGQSEGTGEIAHGLADLIGSRMLSFTCGCLYRRDLLSRLGTTFGEIHDEFVFNVNLLALAKTIRSIPDVVCHAHERSNTAGFDPVRFETVQARYQALQTTADALGVSELPSLQVAISRWYYRAVARCIENLCLSPHSVSSIERNARLRDILDAESTRTAMRRLEGDAKDLGVMYGPISSGNIPACLLGTWVSHNLRFIAR